MKDEEKQELVDRSRSQSVSRELKTIHLGIAMFSKVGRDLYLYLTTYLYVDVGAVIDLMIAP